MSPACYDQLLTIRQNQLSRDSFRDFDMQAEPLLFQHSERLTTSFRKDSNLTTKLSSLLSCLRNKAEEGRTACSVRLSMPAFHPTP